MVDWQVGGRFTRLFGIEANFDPVKERADDSRCVLSLYLPRLELHLYSSRLPILAIEYAPRHSGGPLWIWRNWDAVQRTRAEASPC